MKLKKVMKLIHKNRFLLIKFSGYDETMMGFKSVIKEDLFYIQNLKDREVKEIRPLTETDRMRLENRGANAVSLENARIDNTLYIELDNNLNT